jgi:8-oxo-dGTP pyrophosphatase MutT (NUDIX family)
VDARAEQFKHHVRAVLKSRPRLVVDDPSLRCAAVLIPLLWKEGQWYVVVTQRTQQVEHHKGQVSFPGGACDHDDADLLATALRETYEEIGVPPEAVDILGALDDFPTISYFNVTPFVGVLSQPVAYRPNQGEVETVVEVPMSFLRDPATLRVVPMERMGQVIDVLFWDYGPYTIWGATARMLKNLLDLIL